MNQEANANDMEAGDNHWEPEPHDVSFEAHDVSFEADDSTADGPYVETGGTRLWVCRDENQEAQWKMEDGWPIAVSGVFHMEK